MCGLLFLLHAAAYPSDDGHVIYLTPAMAADPEVFIKEVESFPCRATQLPRPFADSLNLITYTLRFLSPLNITIAEYYNSLLVLVMESDWSCINQYCLQLLLVAGCPYVTWTCCYSPCLLHILHILHIYSMVKFFEPLLMQKIWITAALNVQYVTSAAMGLSIRTETYLMRRIVVFTTIADNNLPYVTQAQITFADEVIYKMILSK